MRRNLLLFFLLWFPVAFAQDVVHSGGGTFVKRIGYNLRYQGDTEECHRYDLDGKSHVDRIFFGEVNAPVEYLFEPSFDEASALRIVRNSPNGTYRIEVMRLSDYQKIESVLTQQYSPIHIPNRMQATLISIDAMAQIHEHNRKVASLRDEIYEPYRPRALSFVVGREFADSLQVVFASLIDCFRAEGVPPTICDGDYVTFRCVKGDEVWSLRIHEPRGKVAQLSELCRQIVADAREGRLNESEYLRALEAIAL